MQGPRHRWSSTHLLHAEIMTLEPDLMVWVLPLPKVLSHCQDVIIFNLGTCLWTGPQVEAEIWAVEGRGPGLPDLVDAPGRRLFCCLCSFCDAGHVFQPMAWKTVVMSSCRITWALKFSPSPL